MIGSSRPGRRRDIHVLELESASDRVDHEGFHGRQHAPVGSAPLVKRCQGRRLQVSTTVNIH